MDDTLARLTGRKPSPPNEVVLTREGSSRLLIYLALTFTPIILILVAGFFLAGRSVRREHESLRVNGAEVMAKIDELEMIHGKGSISYKVFYEYQAFDPEEGRERLLRSDGWVSCDQYMRLQRGGAVKAIYDAKSPTDADLDPNGTFKAGMSEGAFKAWRASRRSYDTECSSGA